MAFPIIVTKSLNPIYTGDDWRFSCVFTRPSDPEPIDLVYEGWTNWQAQWRPYSKSDEFFNLTVDTTQAILGRISVSIPSSITSQILTKGVFDLQANQNGIIRTWIRGDVSVEVDVTR